MTQIYLPLYAVLHSTALKKTSKNKPVFLKSEKSTFKQKKLLNKPPLKLNFKGGQSIFTLLFIFCLVF